MASFVPKQDRLRDWDTQVEKASGTETAGGDLCLTHSVKYADRYRFGDGGSNGEG